MMSATAITVATTSCSANTNSVPTRKTTTTIPSSSSRTRRRTNKGGSDNNRRKQQQKLQQNPSCGVCGNEDAKYKCPKCRTPFCSVKCCKEHKTNCPALTTEKDTKKKDDDSTSTSNETNKTSTTTTMNNNKKSNYLPSDALTKDPLENAIRRRKMLKGNNETNGYDDDDDDDDVEEEGWRITSDIMSRLDNSEWLRKELADGGLRQMIYEIDSADIITEEKKQQQQQQQQRNHNGKRKRNGNNNNKGEISSREISLEKTKMKHPKFKTFIDKLLLTANVLVKDTSVCAEDEDKVVSSILNNGEDEVGPLLLAPVSRRGTQQINTTPSDEGDDSDAVDSNSDSDDSS